MSKWINDSGCKDWPMKDEIHELEFGSGENDSSWHRSFAVEVAAGADKRILVVEVAADADNLILVAGNCDGNLVIAIEAGSDSGFDYNISVEAGKDTVVQAGTGSLDKMVEISKQGRSKEASKEELMETLQ